MLVYKLHITTEELERARALHRAVPDNQVECRVHAEVLERDPAVEPGGRIVPGSDGVRVAHIHLDQMLSVWVDGEMHLVISPDDAHFEFKLVTP